jgi:hypothetical protein
MTSRDDLNTRSLAVDHRGEVKHHRQVFPNNALIVVSGISLQGTDRDQTVGGKLQINVPWAINEQHLTVISYTYQANMND